MRLVFPVLLAVSVSTPVILTGCARLGVGVGRSMPVVDTQYDCVPDGDGDRRHRTISVGPQRSGIGVVLSDAGQRQVLTSTSIPSGPLFSSPFYAWKGDAVGGTLTDVESIQSFHCRRVGRTSLPTHDQMLRAAR